MMPSQRRRKLDALVNELQLNYGPRAIRKPQPGERTPAVARTSTTFPELDALLGGGLPRGRISEICGPATSGKVTLAAKLISAAHHERTTLGAWIDAWRTCDADYMHRCGIDLSRLLVAQPATLDDALTMTLRLVESRALAVLVVDTLTPLGDAQQINVALGGALAQLTLLLAGAPTAVVFLTEHPLQVLAHAAAVRLNIRREQWIKRGRDVRGYEGQVEVAKNRLGETGTARIRITINGTVRGGDGL